MASATVESTAVAAAADTADVAHEHHLRVESLPLIDLRLLTQSELYSLSLSSSVPSPSSQDDFVVPIPKIDRSVFNESAGSRKQTYFRLRLAPRNSSPNLTPSSRQKTPEPLAEENSRIISLLKDLFAPNADTELPPSCPAPVPDEDKSSFVAVNVEYDECVPESSTAVLQNVPIDVVAQPVLKRKRGRPRKHENPLDHLLTVGEVKQVVVASQNVKEQIKEVETGIGERLKAVDLDRFEEELRKRTEGLRTEDDLSGFLRGLSGEWGSRRKKRRIVDARSFGDVLPVGWKLLLSIKNDGDRVWLGCSRYISPDGQQFESSKDVSSHLLSLFGKDASLSNSGPADGSNQLPSQMTSGNSTDPHIHVDQSQHKVVSLPAPPNPSSSVYDQNRAPVVISNTGNIQTKGIFKCHKCTMTFDEKDNLLLHLLSSHKKSRSAAARNGSPNTEAVIMKDGKYECQLCHRLFEEKNRFSSHFGNHIKDYVRRVEGSAETTRGRKSISKLQESVAVDRASTAVPCSKADNERNMGFSHTIMESEATGKIHGTIDSDKVNLPRAEPVVMVVARNEEHAYDDVQKQEMVSDLPDNAVEVVDETSRFATESNVSKDDVGVKSSDQKHSTSETSDQPNVPKIETKANVGLVNSLEDHTQGTGPTSHVAAPDEKTNAINNENLVSSLFGSSMEEMELDDDDEVGNGVLISGIGEPCFGLEEGVVNSDQHSRSLEGSFVQIGDEEQLVNDDGAGTQTSTLVGSEKETGSESCLPSEPQIVLLNPNVDTVIASTLEGDTSYQSWNVGKTIDFNREAAALTKDVESSVQETAMSYPVIQSLNQQCRTKENETGDSTAKVEKHWQQKVLESNSLSASFTSSDCDANLMKASTDEHGNGMSFPPVPSLNQQACTGDYVAKGESLWQQKVCDSSSLSAQLKTSDLDANLMKASSEEGQKGMSCQIMPSLNQQARNNEGHGGGNYTSKVENLWQQKVFKSSSLSAPLKTSHLGANLMKVSSDAMEPFKVNDARPDSSVLNYDEKETSSRGGFPLAPPHQQSFPIINNESCVSTMEDPKDYRSFKGPNAGYRDYDHNNVGPAQSFRSVEKQKQEEATRTWNNTGSFTFDTRYPLHDGSAAMGFVQDRNAEADSNLFSRNTEIVTPDSRGTIGFRGPVEQPRRNKEPMFGLLPPNVDQQPCGINYNMEMFYSGTMPSDRRVGNVAPTRNNDLMIGFYNQPKPREEVMTQPMWRAEENALQNGLNYASPTVPQQSDCFQTFNVASDKVQNDIYGSNQKPGSATVEGIRTSGGEYLEYNFLPAPSSSHSGGSKITPVNQQMQQNFDSNWLEKDALGLFPKMGSGSSANNSNRHQVTPAVCVWCGSELSPDADFDVEAGSVGYMCFSCKSKFSGQINFF